MSSQPKHHVGGSLFAVALLACAGCATVHNAMHNLAHHLHPSTDVPTYSARTFYETTSVSGSSFSHDESRVLMSSDESGVFNVYAQPLPGGKPTMLTHSTTNSMFAVSFFPRDDRFLFTADKGGNERNHLFVRELNGTDRDLTPGDDVKASFAGWSGDKTAFYVTTNERDPKFFDLYKFTTDGYSKQLVFRNTEGFTVSGISDDDRWVALGKVRNNADSDVYVWNTDDPDKAPQLITPHEGDVSHRVMAFTPNSRELYYGTNGHGEFNQVWSYDLVAGDRKPVFKAKWDVSYLSFSENGRYRVTGVNKDARTMVTITETATGRKVRMSNLPPGDIRGVRFSPTETKMAFYVNGSTSPSNLFVLDFATGEQRQITDTLNPAIDAKNLVQSRVIRYRSFDDLKIPAILYKPKTASRSNKVPALVWVHGGPGGQSRQGYSPTIQHLVNHGYAVLAVNNRGSSGYGKTFYHMDDKKHGDVDLKDCVWARKYLEKQDWVDGSRIGIIGGSYGGYMVAAALAFEPEVFDVGIDIFGVTNWVRTLKSIPAWWSAMREGLYAELGDPEKEEERLRRISPLFHAKNIVRPLLVIQGANDPRVLQVESDELVENARKNGVPVEYIVFPDEGHGFRKRENRITASESYLKFLNKHLRGS